MAPPARLTCRAAAWAQVGRPWQPSADTVAAQLLLNATVHAGDMLHLPRGVVHYSMALGDAPSLHYTLSAVRRRGRGRGRRVVFSPSLPRF